MNTSPTLAEQAISDAVRDARRMLQVQMDVERAFLERLDEVLARLARWAVEGTIDGAAPTAEAMTPLRADLLQVVRVFFHPAVYAARPTITPQAIEQGTWLEALVSLVHPDEHLGCMVLAGAARWHLMMGSPILPRLLAAIAQVDQSRIHGLLRDGHLKAAPTRHPVTRPGRRVKGDETRVQPKSALRWLTRTGLAPENAELVGKPSKAKRATTSAR